MKIEKRRSIIMNRTLNQGRYDANPKVEKKEKELNLISTERVSFSQ